MDDSGVIPAWILRQATLRRLAFSPTKGLGNVQIPTFSWTDGVFGRDREESAAVLATDPYNFWLPERVSVHTLVGTYFSQNAARISPK